MSPSLITIADILRVHDYQCIGVTGGGYVSEKFGFSKGFDNYKGERFVFHAPDEAEQLRDITLKYLERHTDKKFFLFLHTYQVHTPYYSHKGITDAFVKEGDLTWDRLHLAQFLREQPEKRKYKFSQKETADIIALYNGEIRYTDEYLIKPLIMKLKQLDLYDRTMIIFTSDHGEEFQDHNSWLHSHTLYNELIKVPLIIKLPESKYAGKKIDTIVRSIDIVPTILESAGIDAEPFNFDGRSLQDIIQGQAKENRTFISDVTRKGSEEFRPRLVCMNQDFFKLIAIRSQAPLRFLLFDLEQDPLETNNLNENRPDLVRSLFQQILDYYNDFKEVEAKSDKVVMDKELEAKLKALGYIR
jgi:arylsulfatase A-like enzyme